jgi:hypothetical protein
MLIKDADEVDVAQRDPITARPGVKTRKATDLSTIVVAWSYVR